MRSFFETLWSKKGLGAWLLSPLSLVYALGWWVYLTVYRVGLKKAATTDQPSICIGNLVAGGAGKTPFVRWLATELAKQGKDVVIGLSGYGSPAQHGASVAPEGPLDPREWGDEACLFRSSLPDVPLIVGRDRVAAAKLAATTFPERLLLMDDGFQHLRFRPRISLVVEPNAANDFCFPAGPYREPTWIGHRRATRVLRFDQEIRRSTTLFQSPDGAPVAPPFKADVICAIGDPARFQASLREAGVELGIVKALTDHDPLQDENLLDGMGLGIPIIVTRKDYGKLAVHHPTLSEWDIVIADYDVQAIEPESFIDWLIKKINETSP